MAIPVNEATKQAIRVVLDAHRAAYAWGHRDCITLVEGVLAAQGIHADFREAGGDMVADTHAETVARAVAKHGSLAAMFQHHLDRVPELERADSTFEWEPGMVGITPQTGMFLVGMQKVDAAALGGSMAGVVAHTGRPMVITLGHGLLPVSALWPRWKPRMIHTVGRG